MIMICLQKHDCLTVRRNVFHLVFEVIAAFTIPYVIAHEMYNDLITLGVYNNARPLSKDSSRPERLAHVLVRRDSSNIVIISNT